MSQDATAEARQYGRTVGVLTGALAVAGGLTYLFFGVASHTLNADEYGHIVVLWAVVFLTISTVFRPVEQLLARTIADHDAQVSAVARAVRIAAGIQLGLGALLAIVALVARRVLVQDLFGGDSALFAVLMVATLSYGVALFVRGATAGSRQFASYTALVVIDSVARLAFAVAAAIGIGSGELTVALGVAAGPVFSLLVIPAALRGRRTRREEKLVNGVHDPAEGGAIPSQTEGAGVEFSLAQGSGFAAAVLAIMLTEQLLLNGGALFARASEGSAAAGYVFNVLMVARAPVVMFQAVAASLLPHLTRLRGQSSGGSSEAFELSIRLTLQSVVAFAAAATLVLVAIGPALMQIAFGTNFSYDRLGLVIVALGMGAYLSAATLNQAALARGQTKRTAAVWLICASSYVVWNLLPIMDAARRVEVGFAVSATLLCAMLAALYRDPAADSRPGISPGSPEELELQLAVADEAGG